MIYVCERNQKVVLDQDVVTPNPNLHARHWKVMTVKARDRLRAAMRGLPPLQPPKSPGLFSSDQAEREAIAFLQIALNRIGAFPAGRGSGIKYQGAPIPTSGAYDNATMLAVTAYQLANFIRPFSGRVSGKTLRKIDMDLWV